MGASKVNNAFEPIKYLPQCDTNVNYFLLKNILQHFKDPDLNGK